MIKAGGDRMRINRVEFAAALAREDLTVKELVRKTGLARCTISNVKRGKSCAKSTAVALAAVLGDQIIERSERCG